MPPIRPEIRGVFPHGGQGGTDLDITISGTNLQGASEIRFATSKITARVVHAEHNHVTARVHLDAAAEPGRHDLRLIAPHGSTIAWFETGTRTESFEKEPNDDIAHAQAVQFPFLMNGTVRAGDYDYFRFTAKAGQTITFDVSGGRHNSGLDSVLTLLDEKGTEIDYMDDYYWFKDPHVVHTFEKAGTYYLRIYGSGESGSPTADYRLTAGEMPQVDYAMPMGAQPGKPTEIQLTGFHLGEIQSAVLGDSIATAQVIARTDRSATLRMTVPAKTPPGNYQLHVAGATLPVPFVVADIPQVTVTTSVARRKDDPYPVKLPVVANGVLDTPRAGHYFRFQVDEAQNVLLAVDSMRLNFDLDPMVAIYDAAGERIAYQDDPTTTNSGKRPANLDPHLVVPLKPGTYTALVRDNAFRGDPAFAYRFTMKRAVPDFEAGTVGTDETLFQGKDAVITVRVRRLEGWNTPIELWAENLPPGITGPAKVMVPVEPTHFKGTCGEDNILDGTEVDFPLHVAEGTAAQLSQIRFRSRGVMDGKTVEHSVQANYWWKGPQKIWGFAETSSLYATVASAPKLVLGVPDHVAAPAGVETTIPVVITRLDGGSDAMELHAVNVPEGITVQSATVRPGGTLAALKVTSRGGPPVKIVLEGVAAGKILGASHPIVIDAAAKPAKQEVTDEN